MILRETCMVLPMAIRITRSVSVVIGAEEKNRKVKSKAEGFSNFQFVTEYWGF